MFKVLDILGLAIVFAAVLAVATRLLAWPIALAGVVVGLNFWALGSIGRKVDRLEKASGPPPARQTDDGSPDRGDTG